MVRTEAAARFIGSLKAKEQEALNALSLRSISALHSARMKENSGMGRFIAFIKDEWEKVHRKEFEKRVAGHYRGPIHEKAYWLLHQFWFDGLLGLLIMVNLVIVVVETDAMAANGETPEWAKTLSWCLIITFFIELILRIYVLGCGFWLDGLNIFDFLVVSMDMFMNVLELIAGPVLSVSCLRIVRLCKLARVAQAFHVCSELRLLLQGLLGCLKAIFWGSVLLLLSLVIFSVLAVQFLHPLNEKLVAAGKHGDCERCGRVYASVFDAFLVFFQQIVAGDSWGYVTVTMIEEYPGTIVLYASLFMFVGMAVLNLILGVVVDVASQARSALQGELENEKVISRMEARHQLLDLCKQIDYDRKGVLNQQDLYRGYKENEVLKTTLNDIGIEEDELDILWTILDEDRSGTVSHVEFVSACYKMKMSHEEFMLAYIKYYVTVIKNQITEEIRLMKKEMEKEDDDLNQLSHVILSEEKVIEDTLAGRQTSPDKKADMSSQNGTTTLPSSPDKAARDGIAPLDAKTLQTTANNTDAIKDVRQQGPSPPTMYTSTMDGNQILRDIFEAMNVRQAELLAAIEAMRYAPDPVFEKRRETMPAVLATPNLSSSCRVPSERTFNQLVCPSSSPGCCRSTSQVKVMKVDPSPDGQAGN